MKYFFDTEFIEGFHKPWFGKRRHFIDLISIGIVAEDGRRYYAISNEFNPKDADEWVYDNVIMNLMVDWAKSYSGDGRNEHLNTIEGTGKYKSVRMMQKAIGKSNKQIARDIQEFCKPARVFGYEGQKFLYSEIRNPEFYAYYADYDWVLFCSLFGRMIGLPSEFPMYCKDLKQMLDDKALALRERTIKNEPHIIPSPFKSYVNGIKVNPNYPKQQNEHNAMDDALWNLALYKFIKTL